MNNYKQPFKNNVLERFKNNVLESEVSKNKISKFIINIDKLFKEKYNDIDITSYFNIIKDKPNKTSYAYVIYFYLNIDISAVLSIYFSLKYNNPIYDIICCINDTNIYEKNYLDDKYLKFDKITDNNIDIIKRLFDVVIGTNMYLIKYNKIGDLMNYSIYNLYGYTLYSKLLIINTSCIINKNIDFLFNKYEKSTYVAIQTHENYSGGLFPSIILINPCKYYIKKAEYLCENYKIIFNNLYFFVELPSNITYFTLYPHWNTERFENNLISCNFSNYPNIDIKYISKKDPYINYYFSKKPFHYYKDNSKFKLNDSSYKKWDENVKRILDEHPQYKNIFEYIKTFRYTLF